MSSPLPTLLNLGSVNLDYVYHVAHFVAPGETLASTGFSVSAGGKGYNQSIALARAGVKVVHAGCVGREAAWLRERLSDEHVDITSLKVVDVPAGHAIIQVVPSGQNSILLHAGANQSLTPHAVPPLLDGLGPGDWFLTQNETSCVAESLRLARAAGLTVCFNPAPMHPDVAAFPLECVDWLFVNETEGRELSGVASTDAETILQRLQERCPQAHVVLTLGADGVCSFPPEGPLVRVAAHRVEAVDTTAAGDTFIGFFLSAVMAGKSLLDALSLGCKAASVSITRPGAADSIPFLHELAPT